MPPERAAARGAPTAAWGPLKEAFTDPNLPGGAAPSGGTGRLFAVGAGCPDAGRAPSDGVREVLRTPPPDVPRGGPASWPNRPSLPATTSSVVLPRAAPRPSRLGATQCAP